MNIWRFPGNDKWKMKSDYTSEFLPARLKNCSLTRRNYVDASSITSIHLRYRHNRRFRENEMNQITPNQGLLGFIGIGHMGSRIARRLLDHGYDLIAYNRSRDAAEALVEHGATVADNVATLASQADVILSCLANDEAVLGVYTGPQGVFAHARPGSVIIEMSTVLPRTSRELHRLGLEAGLKLLDTPISGSTPAAEQGALTLFCGGDEKVFHAAQPIFSAI